MNVKNNGYPEPRKANSVTLQFQYNNFLSINLVQHLQILLSSRFGPTIKDF